MKQMQAYGGDELKLNFVIGSSDDNKHGWMIWSFRRVVKEQMTHGLTGGMNTKSVN
jgi:hypothetical protein